MGLKNEANIIAKCVAAECKFLENGAAVADVTLEYTDEWDGAQGHQTRTYYPKVSFYGKPAEQVHELEPCVGKVLHIVGKLSSFAGNKEPVVHYTKIQGIVCKLHGDQVVAGPGSQGRAPAPAAASPVREDDIPF